MSINQSKDIFYTNLAFQEAEINLGSTYSNPSVGCVLVKNNTVIAAGRTSINGRPHAETNALKKKINYKNSDLYVTLEPCSHFGKTPPCINIIIKKKIKKVIFSINDSDLRSKQKAQKKLIQKKIIVKKFVNKNFAQVFYKSYFLQSQNKLPFIDAKLALSKDYYSINKKNKYITNARSRNLGNFLRSKYECLLTTSKTVNKDNPLLNCRIKGLENKSPCLVILDRHLKIKKNIKIINNNKHKKVFIFTATNNPQKENFLKRKGIQIFKFTEKDNDNINLKNLFMSIKKLGFNRVFVETGASFINVLIKHRLIRNLYLFKSHQKLSSCGLNNTSFTNIKKIKISKKNKVNVNLNGDSLYKVKL